MNYTLVITVIGKDEEVNQICCKKYNKLNEIFIVLQFLDRLKKLIRKIRVIKIQFEMINTIKDIENINRFSEKILISEFFIEYCHMHNCKVMLNDENHKNIRTFYIILDSDITDTDPHCDIFSRSEHYEDRLKSADP